jgi:hypothetical protein
MSTHYRLLLVFTSVLAGQIAAAGSQDQWKPAPEIKRTTPIARATLFERPDAIVELRVRKSCEMAPNADVFPPGEPRDVLRQYLAHISYPYRINGRRAHGPDVSTAAEFTVLPRTDSVGLKVGHTYILFLDADMDFVPNAAYKISHKQMGFELSRAPDGLRVSPIIKGGELDAYDGFLLNDLMKLIQMGK